MGIEEDGGVGKNQGMHGLCTEATIKNWDFYSKQSRKVLKGFKLGSDMI